MNFSIEEQYIIWKCHKDKYKNDGDWSPEQIALMKEWADQQLLFTPENCNEKNEEYNKRYKLLPNKVTKSEFEFKESDYIVGFARKINCIGVIECAHNCPAHDSSTFWNLHKFKTLKDIKNYLLNKTLSPVGTMFIDSLWTNTTPMEKSKIDISYNFASHAVSYIDVRKDGILLFKVKLDPYKKNTMKLEQETLNLEAM